MADNTVGKARKVQGRAHESVFIGTQAPKCPAQQAQKVCIFNSRRVEAMQQPNGMPPCRAGFHFSTALHSARTQPDLLRLYGDEVNLPFIYSNQQVAFPYIGNRYHVPIISSLQQ